jgi:hypothetical protein
MEGPVNDGREVHRFREVMLNNTDSALDIGEKAAVPVQFTGRRDIIYYPSETYIFTLTQTLMNTHTFGRMHSHIVRHTGTLAYTATSQSFLDLPCA